MKDIIKELVSDFHQRKFEDIMPRELVLPLNTGKIISVLGVRRSGKTYLLLDTVKKLLSKGKKIEQVLYLNFEDERLSLKTSELDLILQAYRELFPDANLSKTYFFFDEIQNVDGWEKFIRRVYDTITKNIYLTGSNSKFLGKEIASSLRGRTVTYEVFPLSYLEYLSFEGLKADNISSRNKAKLVNAFDVYLKNGGFPETIKMNDVFRDKTLQEYFNIMLYKDMVERYNISNTNILKYFLERLLLNLGKPTSVNKIYNELKSNNYKTTKNILYDMLDWAESIYYLFRVYKFNYSRIDREKSDKKVYIVDNGLVNSLTFRFSEDYGQLLENLVAVHLKRKYEEKLFYFKNGSECDFVTFEKTKPDNVVQVSYDVSDKDTLARELRGLYDACEYLKIKRATIVTQSMEKQMKHKGISVNIIPAYKYLLL
ncbi:MAG: ATP-binding protein [bacterium]